MTDRRLKVVVRDGEYVFSTSLGRDKAGRLITQERQDDESGNGERGEAYELPYMSEGIIELDGEIIATYVRERKCVMVVILYQDTHLE